MKQSLSLTPETLFFHSCICLLSNNLPGVSAQRHCTSLVISSEICLYQTSLILVKKYAGDSLYEIIGYVPATMSKILLGHFASN